MSQPADRTHALDAKGNCRSCGRLAECPVCHERTVHRIVGGERVCSRRCAIDGPAEQAEARKPVYHGRGRGPRTEGPR